MGNLRSSWRAGGRIGRQLAGNMGHPGDQRYTSGFGYWIIIAIVVAVCGGVGRKLGCDCSDPFQETSSVTTTKPSSQTTGGRHCGDAAHRPTTIDSGAWAKYRCRPRSEMGDRWDQCLRHKAYSTVPGTGCPGNYGEQNEERCCPPD